MFSKKKIVETNQTDLVRKSVDWFVGNGQNIAR